MRNFIFFSFILLGILYPEISMSQTKSKKFEVNGITVILKPTVKDIVNVQIYFRGGVANYNKDEAGIENLALQGATECGTTLYSKTAFKDSTDKYGIEITGSAGYDAGKISLNCLNKYFDKGWSLFTQAVTQPLYEQKDFDLLKLKLISGVKENNSDPDYRINKIARINTFKETLYNTDPQGEVNTLSRLTEEDARKYYFNTLLNKKRMFIVVVGKISGPEIADKIKKSFSNIPSSPYTAFRYVTPQIKNNSLDIESRKLATNYIMGIANAPQFKDADYAANLLAINSLSDNLFEEIRTKRNLSYAVFSFHVSGKIPYNFVYVTTTDPRASIEVITNEIKRLQTNGYSQKELNDTRNLYLTNNYLKEESANYMASLLGKAEILGNWKNDEELMERIMKVTPQEMTSALKKYVNGISWNYLGDEAAASGAKDFLEESRD